MSHRHSHAWVSQKDASHLLNPLRELILSPRKLVKRLGLHKESKVLEVGPGPGYFSLEVARRIPEGTLVLVDIRREMLDIARERLEKKGILNVEYVKGDAHSLPVESNYFDVAFLVTVLGHISDRRQCLRELYRVLRPNGLLSITEQPFDRHRLSWPEVLELAHKEGFCFEKCFGRGTNFTVNFRKPTV